jgi:hypothetical protein
MTTGEVKELDIPNAGEVIIILDEKKNMITVIAKDKYTITLREVKKLYHEFIRADLPPEGDHEQHDSADVPQ